MSPILFLDFDGVLNSHDFMFPGGVNARPGSDPDEMLDPAAVERLNQIVSRTGCDVVVSSAWRCGRSAADLEMLLAAVGYIYSIRDVTPYHTSGIRGREIQAWISSNPPKPEAVCILDDDDDMAHLKRFLVKTTFKRGLQDEHVERAVAMLNKEKTNAVSR